MVTTIHGTCPVCKHEFGNKHVGKKQIIVYHTTILLNVFKCGTCDIYYAIEVAERED